MASTTNDFLDLAAVAEVSKEGVTLEARKIRVGWLKDARGEFLLDEDGEKIPDFVTFQNPILFGDIFEYQNVLNFINEIALLAMEIQAIDGRNHGVQKRRMEREIQAAFMRKYGYAEILYVLEEWAGEADFAKLRAAGLTNDQFFALVTDLGQFFGEQVKN